MFGTSDTTDYDWQFTLLGIPVRVTGWFWIGTLILGSKRLESGLDGFLIWVAAVFVSILVHEMGHALMYAFFGVRSHIVLHQMGGLAFGDRRLPHLQSIFVSFAGPGAGFLLLALVMLAPETENRLGFVLLDDLYFINLWWGLINLLPVLPLDGGRICDSVCCLISPRGGTRAALLISVVVGAGLASYFFQHDQMYTAILFGVFAFYSLRSLQAPTNPW